MTDTNQPAFITGFRKFLSFIGEDPDRQGLKDTPVRHYQALAELTQGQRQDEQEFLNEISRQFDIGDYDQLIVVDSIPFCSLCEHHVLPFTGTAAIGYIPAKTPTAPVTGYRVLGLSKLARIVDFYAKRLQVQERMTSQIAKALQQVIPTAGVGVIINAEHTCMTIRGIKAVGSVTTTIDVRGTLRESSSAKEEFLTIARYNRGIK